MRSVLVRAQDFDELQVPGEGSVEINPPEAKKPADPAPVTPAAPKKQAPKASRSHPKKSTKQITGCHTFRNTHTFDLEDVNELA